jgi:NTE family protein
MVPDADRPTPDSDDETPPSRRRGIGLCLSGGGFRATLFPPRRAIQRVFELGIATRPDFDTLASVSGGSLTSAQWAIAETRAKAENRNLDFTRDVARPLQALASTDIRTGALAKKFFLPWNWFRGAYATNARGRAA